MQIQNNHISLLQKKIRELQCIRRAQEQSIAMLTKELDEISQQKSEGDLWNVDGGGGNEATTEEKKNRTNNDQKYDQG